MGSALRISGIVPESIVEGPGIRLTVFTQGCPHHCPGCHNPQTHDFAGGTTIDVEEILRQVEENPLLRGVTLSGGEPFCQPDPLCELARGVKGLGKTVMTYSGYTYEQLAEQAQTDPAVRELLRLTDILVDGPSLEAQRDLTLRFRGSRNQRILRLRDGVLERVEDGENGYG